MPIIDADNLYSTLKEYIDEYGEEAVKANEEAIRKTAKEVTRELKKAGSFGGTGKYRKSITNEIRNTRIGVSASIGAGKQAGLTHLLEFGHAKRNGGRTTAFNFVAPINDTVEEKYMKAMEDLLK